LIQINAVAQIMRQKASSWLAQFDDGNDLRDRQRIK
jgi:hypothetical protein